MAPTPSDTPATTATAPEARRSRRAELTLAALTLAATAFVLTRTDSAPRAAREEAPSHTLTDPSGATVRVPVRPLRVLPASTGLLDWLAPLVAPERLAAIPNLSEDYAVVAKGPGAEALLARPRWVQFQSEAIIEHRPDLVLVQEWHSRETRERLAQYGLPVVELPEVSSWEELVRATTFLGELVDEREAAAALVQDLERRRAALATRRAGKAPRVVLYSNYNAGSVGSVTGLGTTMDLTVALAGARNAVAERGLGGHLDADLELLFTLDPDVLVVSMDDEGASATLDYIRATRTFDQLRAVREGQIARLDGRLTSAASHHVLDAAEALVLELERLGR